MPPPSSAGRVRPPPPSIVSATRLAWEVPAKRDCDCWQEAIPDTQRAVANRVQEIDFISLLRRGLAKRMFGSTSSRPQRCAVRGKLLPPARAIEPPGITQSARQRAYFRARAGSEKTLVK